jgi:hypothetical protein
MIQLANQGLISVLTQGSVCSVIQESIALEAQSLDYVTLVTSVPQELPLPLQTTSAH